MSTTNDPQRIDARIGRIRELQERLPERPTPEAYREPDWDITEGADTGTALGWDMPSRLRWARTDDFKASITAELDAWASNPQGRNLVIFGPVGVGKSHAAVAACRVAAEHHQEVRFVPSVELFELLRPDGPPGYLAALMGLDRLIIDDLGAERATEWSTDRLYAVLNRRWLEERPTVVTTNMGPEQLAEELRPDIFSRLCGSDAVLVRLTGADRRMVGPGGAA